MRASFCLRPFLLLFVLGVVAVPAADAQTLLRLRFEKGKSNPYELNQTMKVEQNVLGQSITSVVKQMMQFTMTCDDVEGNGNGKITTRFERARMEIEAPEPVGKFVVDSTQEASEGAMAAKLSGMIKILGKLEFTTIMTPRSEIVDFKIPEAVLEQLKGIPGSAQFGGIFTEEGIKLSMAYNKLLLPQDKVSPGAKWTHKIASKLPFGKLTGELKYVYAADEGKLQKLTYDPVLSIEPSAEAQVAVKLDAQKGSGTILFDNVAGRIQSMSLNQTLELSVGTPGVNLSQKIEQTMSMRLREK
jgi:hypothetical protein